MSYKHFDAFLGNTLKSLPQSLCSVFLSLSHAIYIVEMSYKWANIYIFMAFVWRGIPERVSGRFALSRCHFPSFRSVLLLLNCGQTLCKLPSLQRHRTHRSSFEILHSCRDSFNLVYCPRKYRLMQSSFINHLLLSCCLKQSLR